MFFIFLFSTVFPTLPSALRPRRARPDILLMPTKNWYWTLECRKKKASKRDFIRSAATLGIENGIVERLINKYIKLLPKFETVIKSSFLSAELKEKYGELLKDRLARLSQGMVVTTGLLRGTCRALHAHADRPADVALVVDVLDTWDFIEARLEKLSAEELEKVATANYGYLPLFAGFDGKRRRADGHRAVPRGKDEPLFPLQGADFNSHSRQQGCQDTAVWRRRLPPSGRPSAWAVP